MKSLILSACLFPLALIWIIMKLSLWIAAVSEEQSYVGEEKHRVGAGFVENPYADVDENDEEYGSKTDYR